MKKYAKIITAILLVSLLALTLFACFDSDNDTQGKMTLVILDGDDAQEFIVDLSKIPCGNSSTGLVAVLEYLQSQGKLTYTMDGTLITQLGDLQNDVTTSSYIWLYTDVESDINVGAYANTISYKGKTYTDSFVGADLMSIKDGCTIIISMLIFG